MVSCARHIFLTTRALLKLGIEKPASKKHNTKKREVYLFKGISVVAAKVTIVVQKSKLILRTAVEKQWVTFRVIYYTFAPHNPKPMRNGAMIFAGISGCIAIMLGALGAHALSGKVDAGVITPKSLHAFETAVHYQMLHTLAIIGMIAVRDKYPLYFKTIMGLFMVGIILFSGSIYGLVAGDLTGVSMHWLGPVTPLGGLCFIAGWFTIALSAINCKKAE